MTLTSQLRDLIGTIHVSPDPTSALYIVCTAAQEMAGARNAMIAELANDRSSLIMRAGTGSDWKPEYVGLRIGIGTEDGQGIISIAALSGSSFVTGDVTGELVYRKLIEGTKSELASPIVDRYGMVRGVINVESNEPDRFGDEEQTAVELLAMIAGYVFDREDSHVREEAFWEVGTALDEATTEDQLLTRVAEITQKVLRVNAYSLFLWEESEGAFVLRDSVGASALSKDAKYLPGEGCTGWVCQHGLPIRLHDPESDARWRGRFVEFPKEEIYAFICVPIFGSNRAMGCMRAIRRKASNAFWDVPFTEDDERLLLSVADQLGAGLLKIRATEKLITSERMAAIGEMSARTSHMIGNRVFGIAGDVNELRHVLSDETIDRESALEVVHSLSRGIKRLEEIIQDYKDFVSATKLQLGEDDLNQVVREAAMSIVPKSSPVQIELRLDEELHPFRFDSMKIGRAVSELVENSLHYMTEGKLIVGTGIAGREELAELGWLRKKEKFAKIYVEDQGPGVAEDSKRSIFYAYQSSRSKGIGLGLSIVKGIADSHGGAIFENGKPGEGARFVILIPYRVAQARG